MRTIAIGAARGKTAVGSATAGLDAHAGDSHMHNLREQVGLIIEGVLSGPRGGDVQIAARVATGEVHAVIFLVDPLNAHPHDPDIQAVQRVCNVHNVPLATNLATASLLVTAEKV